MLKLRKLKQEADEAKAAGATGKKVSSAHLRVQKDISDCTLPATMRLIFPDKEDLMHFRLELRPDEGIYRRGTFHFDFAFNANYPIEPPKVRCVEKIYHPNIDLQGNVCLNILREDWKPILNVQAIVVGIQFLILEPNQNDPLNKDAAASLQRSQHTFRAEVERSMMGGTVGSEKFDRVI